MSDSLQVEVQIHFLHVFAFSIHLLMWTPPVGNMHGFPEAESGLLVRISTSFRCGCIRSFVCCQNVRLFLLLTSRCGINL